MELTLEWMGYTATFSRAGLTMGWVELLLQALHIQIGSAAQIPFIMRDGNLSRPQSDISDLYSGT